MSNIFNIWYAFTVHVRYKTKIVNTILRFKKSHTSGNKKTPPYYMNKLYHKFIVLYTLLIDKNL